MKHCGINLVRKRSKDRASGKGKNRVREMEVSTKLKIRLPGGKGRKELKGWHAAVRDKGVRFH